MRPKTETQTQIINIKTKVWKFMQPPLTFRKSPSWAPNRRPLAHWTSNIKTVLWGRCRLIDNISVLSEPRHARRISSHYLEINAIYL